MNPTDNGGKPADQIKKPSIGSQLVPYIFTAAILVYVFTGLSSKVVDERYTLTATEGTELKSRGLRPSSLEMKSIDGSVVYCEKARAEKDAGSAKLIAIGCPPGGDFELRHETREAAAALRRT